MKVVMNQGTYACARYIIIVGKSRADDVEIPIVSRELVDSMANRIKLLRLTEFSLIIVS
jgi:hypothetical protein